MAWRDSEKLYAKTINAPQSKNYYIYCIGSHSCENARISKTTNVNIGFDVVLVCAGLLSCDHLYFDFKTFNQSRFYMLTYQSFVGIETSERYHLGTYADFYCAPGLFLCVCICLCLKNMF